jgi:hypothetical protein
MFSIFALLDRGFSDGCSVFIDVVDENITDPGQPQAIIRQRTLNILPTLCVENLIPLPLSVKLAFSNSNESRPLPLMKAPNVSKAHKHFQKFIDQTVASGQRICYYVYPTIIDSMAMSVCLRGYFWSRTQEFSASRQNPDSMLVFSSSKRAVHANEDQTFSDVAVAPLASANQIYGQVKRLGMSGVNILLHARYWLMNCCRRHLVVQASERVGQTAAVLELPSSLSIMNENGFGGETRAAIYSPPTAASDSGFSFAVANSVTHDAISGNTVEWSLPLYFKSISETTSPRSKDQPIDSQTVTLPFHLRQGGREKSGFEILVQEFEAPFPYQRTLLLIIKPRIVFFNCLPFHVFLKQAGTSRVFKLSSSLTDKAAEKEEVSSELYLDGVQTDFFWFEANLATKLISLSAGDELNEREWCGSMKVLHFTHY